MKIQIYMTYRCPRCETLEKNLKEAINELNLDVEIERIDVEQATKMKVTSSPALIVNGDIKSYGIVLSVDELKKILKENM